VPVISLALDRTLTYTLLVYSLNHLSSALVAVILLLDPILAAVSGFAFFNEVPSFLDSIAFILVLVGLFFSISSKSAIKT
jgi:drug/metabolite transporter (DMT)-like permease